MCSTLEKLLFINLLEIERFKNCVCVLETLKKNKLFYSFDVRRKNSFHRANRLVTNIVVKYYRIRIFGVLGGIFSDCGALRFWNTLSSSLSSTKKKKT